MSVCVCVWCVIVCVGGIQVIPGRGNCSAYIMYSNVEHSGKGYKDYTIVH